MIKYQSEKFLNGGFTLIETLISVSIIAVLATATIYILNPFQFVAQNNDYTRVNDLEILDKAIKLSKIAETFTDNTESKKVYISLPDVNAILDDDCKNDYPTLPNLVSGWEYRCVSSGANLQNIDGAGWVPIGFSTGQFIDKLPIDPVNISNSSNNNFYTYSWESKKNAYSLTAKLDSEKYISQTAANDGGNSNIIYETKPADWMTVAMADVNEIAASGVDWYGNGFASVIFNLLNFNHR